MHFKLLSVFALVAGLGSDSDALADAPAMQVANRRLFADSSCKLPPAPSGGAAEMRAVTNVARHLGGEPWVAEANVVGSGDVYQFGVAAGASLVNVLSKAYAHMLGTRIWGFDSFDGVPAEPMNEATAWKPGVYRQKDPEGLMKHLMQRLAQHQQTVKFIRGLYSTSLSADLACKLKMRPASYIDIDCDIYTGAIQALDWAFAHGVAQVGTVIGYDDWMVMPCSTGTTDVWQFGESKAHFNITHKYRVRFECLSGPCHDTPEGTLFCRGIPNRDCWRPYFRVVELGATVPDTGYNTTQAQLHRFIEDKSNPRCAGAGQKNPVTGLVVT